MLDLHRQLIKRLQQRPVGREQLHLQRRWRADRLHAEHWQRDRLQLQPSWGLTSVATGGTTVASYAYDGTGLRTSETAGGTTYNFAYNITASTPLILTDGQYSYIYGPSNTPIEQISNSGTELYLHQDALGSVRSIGNQSGTVVATFTYNSYGGIANSTGTTTSRFGYAGAYTDPETGFLYLDNRYYDPTTGQFLTVDPLEAVTGQPYAYTNDDPINSTDPSGMDCTSCTGPGGTRPDSYCGAIPSNVCGGGAWQACIGGSVAPGIYTLSLDLCFVSTPHGDGVAVTPSLTFGPGLGGNLHVGVGVSNACTPGDYGGPFGQAGGSATFGVGGYGNAFTNAVIPGHGRTVSGENSGVTFGLGGDVGGGGSQTWVWKF